MPARHVDHLLIGGGIASATAAQTLRDNGADGSIAIVARELDPPYHRPPASKGYLEGRETREQTLIHPQDWYEENRIELLTRTSVMALDLDARAATLSNKDEVEFGQALVATGATVRRLSVDGAQLEGIHYLRALGNADTIRRDTEQAEHVLLVGGSYIASEVAASLTTLGHSCTMVMLESITLENAFGKEAGRFFHETLESHGVTIVGSEEVAFFRGRGQGDDARVTHVHTQGGRVIEADAVVVGVGAQPDVTLARRAGLEIGELGGVRTDSLLRAGTPGVFAAGDIAEYDSLLHGRVMRIEHEDVAAEQGRTAALNMLGREQPHTAVPYFFSDLADWTSLEYVGPALEWDTEITRGSMDDGEFSQWYLRDHVVVGCLSVGRSEDLEDARRLMTAHTSLGGSEQQLADTDTDLSALGPATGD